MKFSQRLVMIFLPLAIISVVLIGIFSFLNADQMISDSLETNLTAISYSKLSSFGRWIRDISRMMESVAQRPLVQASVEEIMDVEPGSEAFQEASTALIDIHLIPNLTARGGITDYFILDPATGEILVSTDESMIGRMREDKKYFQQGKVETYADRIEYSPAEGETVMHISTPIHSNEGKLVGVLVGHVDLDELTRIMQDDPYSVSTQETYLINDAHLVITDPKNTERYYPQQLMISDGIDRCIQGQEGFGEYADYAGVSVYGSYLWSEEWGFCVLTEVDQAIANQPILELRNLAIIGALVLSALVVFLSIVFARISTRPITDLLAGVQEIGKGNLQHHIPPADIAEFQQLGQAVNEMASNLFLSYELNQRMFKEVQDSRDSLEIQVQERTHELLQAQNATLNMLVDLEEAQRDLARQAADLKRSNEELEQFAYIASHDLQEPLRMVASYLQLIERRFGEKLDAPGKEFIHYAVDGATRMKDLINDLLEYSRVGTKGRPFEWVELNSVVGRVCANMQPTIEASQSVITVGDLPRVMADERQMVQLFQNLIANAIKFRGKDIPVIQVSALTYMNPAEGREWCKISVRDNGIGIEPQYFERIFVIFQRLHTTAEYEGTGIGLAICKKIVERHLGRITVESEPGKGSLFEVSLPVEHQDEED